VEAIMGFFNKALEADEQLEKKRSKAREVTPQMRAQAADLEKLTKPIARPLGVDAGEAAPSTSSTTAKTQAKPRTTFLGNGVRFEGDIRTRGDIKINGQMKGRINSRDGVLVLGTDARIQAHVALRDFVVAGTFEGTVESARKIEVRSTGRLHGDLCTRRLLLEEGAIVEGKVHMKEEA
jgi:cytoskeletal protein CcmA (bactofilin family)